MFSDFRQHVIGVPQVVPSVTNMVFDGPGANEDFGLEQITGNAADRYMFRTAPLRNAAVMPAFMHNGAFIQLEDAIRHHLNPYTSARTYNPNALPPDLRGPLGPIEPVLARLDPLLQTPIVLSVGEFSDLVDFVQNGLLDPRILPRHLEKLIPRRVPSGSQTLTFEFNFSGLERGSETAVSGEENTIPTTAELLQNYPNPFNPSTTITFAIPQASFTTLKVYDILGQEVATLVNEEMKQGTYEVNWSASSNSSGVYLYRLQAGEFTETKQMILLR